MCIKIKNGKNFTLINSRISMINKLIAYKSKLWQIETFNSILFIPTLFLISHYKNPSEYENQWNIWNKGQEEIIIKKNNKYLYQFKYFIDAQNYIWYDDNHGEEIINDIRKMIFKIIIC